MSKKLTQAQVQQYRRDGYTFPIRAFSAEQARHYRSELEAYEASVGAKITALGRRTKHKMKTYMLCDWAYEIATHAAVLDAVEDILGPNLVLAHGNIFVKEARTTEVAAWHQDAPYFGFEPIDEVAVWIALSEATEESGFMKFLPGSVEMGVLQHKRGYVGSMNSLAQAVDMNVDESRAVQASLAPGEFSMHHPCLLHYSGPNRSADRRIGYQMVYVPTHVRCTGSKKRTGLLVRGVDTYGNFELDDLTGLDEAGRYAAHEHACQRFRDCHDEQVRWHEEGRDKYGRERATA